MLQMRLRTEGDNVKKKEKEKKLRTQRSKPQKRNSRGVKGKEELFF